MSKDTEKAMQKGAEKSVMPRKQLKHLSHETLLEEAGPSGLASSLVFILCAMLIIGIVWSKFVTIQTSATTTGTVVTSGKQRVIQHLEGGIVEEINISEGELVQEGQVLLSFEPIIRQAELNQMRAREGALTIKLRRLRAFIDNSDVDFSDLKEDFPNLVEESMFTLNGTRERIEGQKAVLQSRIEQQIKSVDIYDKQARSLQKQVDLMRETVDMRENLFKSGHGSRVNLLNSQLELAKLQGSLTEAGVSKEQAFASISETENEILEIDVRERGEALEQQEEVLAELAEVREKLQRLEDQVSRLDVISPISGRIHNMEINTQGAVVEPAQILMSIIPDNETVIIENQIDPADVGHIQIGQPTKVTVTGFDARRYGTVDGKLVKVSPSTFTDEQGNPFFKGSIELDKPYIEANGRQNLIMPGMTVQANIITGDKSLLEYLTGPVYLSLFNAFSER